MDEDRTSWPLIIGITAGVVGALAAVAIIYSSRRDDGPVARLRDASEIIAQCRDQIKEIEQSLDLSHEAS